MNKKISIVGLILALAVTLGLSGCGNTGSQQSSGSQGSQSTPSVSDNKETSSTKGSTTEEFLKTITLETAEAKGVCGADLTWYYKENVLVIKGTGDMTDWDDTGKTPAMPWHAAGIANQIIHVYIEDGVTSIGSRAFYYWFPGYESAIAKVVIGKDVKLIGIGAFDGRNIEFEFKGDAPEGIEDILQQRAKTIKYSGSSFDSYVEDYPEIEWIKQ